MEIHWNDKLAIDNGVIDDDHRLAIFIANDFIRMKKHEMTRERAIEVIDALRLHMRRHCQREEHFQKSIGFEPRAEHADEHRRLNQRLDQIVDKLEYAPIAELPGLVQATTNVLRTWLVDHILKDDIGMRDAIAAHGAKKDGDEAICFV